MAIKRGKHSRRRARLTIPVAIVAGFIPAVQTSWRERNQLAYWIPRIFAGWDGANFNPLYLKDGTIPVAIGFGIHWVASKVGLNRMLGRLRIPFLRV